MSNIEKNYMQRKIGVVILNYKNYNETIECVDSVLVQKNVDMEIIIVDNGSANGSEKILKERYQQEKNVYFINLKENIGFACGNNVGIKYARETLKCEYVMVLNSDTILTQEDILDQINLTEINENKVGVLNCRCVDLDGEELRPNSYSDNLYIRYLVRIIRDGMLYFTKRHRVIQSKKIVELGKYSIQGCAYFLTPNFFEFYTQIYPGTFLYNEEDALALYLKKAGLTSKYLESAVIIHKMHKSTDANILKIRQQKKFIFKNKLKIAGLVFCSQKMLAKKYS